MNMTTQSECVDQEYSRAEWNPGDGVVVGQGKSSPHGDQEGEVRKVEETHKRKD